MQSHATEKAWASLPSQLHTKEQKQHQIRPQGKPARYSKAAEELRIHEAACRALDRTLAQAVRNGKIVIFDVLGLILFALAQRPPRITDKNWTHQCFLGLRYG